MGLYQAEQLCTLDYMYSCLYSTVQLIGTSLASVEVSLTLVNKFVKKPVKKFVKKFVNDRQIHSGVYRLAPASKNGQSGVH